MGDFDHDSLSNRLEISIGSSPEDPDSDGDGILDGDEIGQGTDPNDFDGDGRLDINESAILDWDDDCIANQFDAQDTVPDSDLSVLVSELCSELGVCADATRRYVVCEKGDNDDKVARCVYEGAAPVAVEDERQRCDSADNDCDGVTDEGHPDIDDDGLAFCDDPDDDNDGVLDEEDNCQEVSNADLADIDGDGLGDACDSPAAPRLTDIAPADLSPNPTPRISGIADPFHFVSIYVNDPTCTGPSNAEAVVNAAGAFNANVSVFASATSTFSAVSYNTAGLRSACAKADFDYTHVVVPSDRPTAPTGQSDTPTVIYTTTGDVTVRLCIAEDAVGHVHLFGADAIAICAEPPAANIWELTVDATAPAGACAEGFVPVSATIPLDAAGEFVLRATTTADDGGTSDCSEVAKVVNLPNPPAAPTLIAVSPPSPSNQTNLAVRVTAERLTHVLLYLDAQCADTAAADAWVPAIVPASGVAMPLTVPENATTAVYARAIDRIAQSSQCVVLFSHTHVGGAGVRAAPPTAHPTALFSPPSPNNTAPAPTATICLSEGGVDVDLYRGAACALSPGFGAGDALGSFGPATADASCAQGFSVTGVLPLSADSTTAISADFVGSSGLRSFCGALGTYAHDATPPAPLIAVAFTPASPSADPSPHLSATGEPRAAALFFGSPGCTGPAIGSGVVSALGELDAQLHMPAMGTNRIWATLSDVLGNTSDCAEVGSYELQTVTVPAPLRVAPMEPHIVTNQDSVTIQVCAAEDHTTTVFVDYTLLGVACDPTSAPGLMTPTAGGSCPAGTQLMEFTVGVENGGLASNATTRVSVQTSPNALEVASPCRVIVDVEHDNIAPDAPQLTPPLAATPSAVAQPMFYGTGEAAAILGVFADAACAGVPSAPGSVVNGGGVWQTQVSVAANTTSTVYGHLTDLAGNTSSCASLRTLTHDDIPPIDPTLATLPPSPSSDVAPLVTVCTEAGATLAIYADRRCTGPVVASGPMEADDGACADVSDGMWTHNIPVSADATTSIYARATDAAGNKSWCEPLVAYVHDATPPAAPIVDTQRAFAWDDLDVDFMARGQAEVGARVAVVRLSVGEQVPADQPCVGSLGEVGTDPTNRDGVFAVPYAVPHTEPVRVALMAVDVAGNKSLCAGPFVMVDSATLALDELARYKTTAGFEAGTVSFHRPDGTLYASESLDTSADSTTALVFEGCFGAAWWMSQGLLEENYTDDRGRPVAEDIELRGVDTVHLSPGDDLRIRLRRMVPAVEPYVETPNDVLYGNWNLRYPDTAFPPGSMLQIVWNGCPNDDVTDNSGNPTSAIYNVNCKLGECSGTFSQIPSACLDANCVSFDGPDQPCSITERNAAGRIVAMTPQPGGPVAPSDYSDVQPFQLSIAADGSQIGSPDELVFTSFGACDSTCSGGEFWRAELPAVITAPAEPAVSDYTYFQRCRFQRTPWEDRPRAAEGHVTIDTTCWTSKVCIEGSEPACTRYEYQDDLLIFPIPAGEDARLVPDPQYVNGMNEFAVVPVVWRDGDVMPVSLTVSAWDTDLVALSWPRRFHIFNPTIDGAPALGDYNAVRLALTCRTGNVITEAFPTTGLDSLNIDAVACYDSRQCVETVGGECVRYLNTTTAVAIGYDVDPGSLPGPGGNEDLGEPVAYTEPFQFQWYDDQWIIDMPFGPWRTDWRMLNVEVVNDVTRTVPANVGAGNIFGATPLGITGSVFSLDNFNPDFILGATGAGGTVVSKVGPALTDVWGVHFVAFDVAFGLLPRLGFSIVMQGGTGAQPDDTTVVIDAASSLVTVHHAEAVVGLGAYIDPDYRFSWTLRPTSLGGAPLDAVVLFGFIDSERDYIDPNPPPIQQWMRTHVMPPWAADGELAQPEPPAGLEAWRPAFFNTATQAELPAASFVATTSGFTAGDFAVFKRDFLTHVPSLTEIAELKQEVDDPDLPYFLEVLTSAPTFRFGLSLGGYEQN